MADAAVGLPTSIELSKDETWQLLLSLRFHYVYRTNKAYLVPLITKLEAHYDSLPATEASRAQQRFNHQEE